MSTAALLEEYRPALTGHCYRMLGSVVDAQDAVQESMLRAWESIDHFREQSSLKTWLYCIATNVCLDTLSASNRQRLRPLELSDQPGVVTDDLVLTQRSHEHWVEPIPGTPAFAQYRQGGEQPWALILLELEEDRITSMTSYLDVETLFPRFGLPTRLAS